MILTYLNDFLSQNKGLSVQSATLVGWVGRLHEAAGQLLCLNGTCLSAVAAQWCSRCTMHIHWGCVECLPALCPLQILLVLGIGGAAGVLGGGWVGQYLYNRHKWSMSVFIGAFSLPWG